MQSAASYKVVFFGSLGVMSYAALAELLRLKVNIVNVVIPGSPPSEFSKQQIGEIPITQSPQHNTIELLALEHHIPITYVQQLDKLSAYSAISKYNPDFILVACFPFILPTSLWQLPNVSSVNMHPSLLPKYRGPHPVFWQLKRNETHTGVTLHQISDVIDGGNILIQKDVPLKHGMRERAIHSLMGEQGAKSFIEVLKLQFVDRLEPRKQSVLTATYMSSPKPEDFLISTSWTAQQAFSFMRGTEDWKQQYQIQIGNVNLFLDSAIAYSPMGVLQESHHIDGNYVSIRFSHGVLQAFSLDPLSPTSGA